jgi:hypothetical protein
MTRASWRYGLSSYMQALLEGAERAAHDLWRSLDSVDSVLCKRREQECGSRPGRLPPLGAALTIQTPGPVSSYRLSVVIRFVHDQFEFVASTQVGGRGPGLKALAHGAPGVRVRPLVEFPLGPDPLPVQLGQLYQLSAG